MKGEANVNPTESVAYRKSLLEKGRKEMTMEEKEWLECNPEIFWSFLEIASANWRLSVFIASRHIQRYQHFPSPMVIMGISQWMQKNIRRFPIWVQRKAQNWAFALLKNIRDTCFVVSKLDSSRIKNVALVGKYSFSGFGNDADRNRAKQDSVCL